jgi:hypothetical protein
VVDRVPLVPSSGIRARNLFLYLKQREKVKEDRALETLW